MQNSLHLVGDGDDVDVVEDVKYTFSIEISDAEAAATHTVGALHDLIESKCGGEPTQVCHTLRAFYRLRRALNEMGADRPITPETPIDVIVAARPGALARSWYELSRRSGLKLPKLETPFRSEPPSRFVSHLLWSIAFVLLLAFFLFWEKLGISRNTTWLIGSLMVVLVPFSWFAFQLAFRNIPRRIRTLGDLAKEAAGHSYSSLNDHRACSASDRWQALVAILRDISGHKGPVTRETTFFAK